MYCHNCGSPPTDADPLRTREAGNPGVVCTTCLYRLAFGD